MDKMKIDHKTKQQHTAEHPNIIVNQSWLQQNI